MIQIGNKTVGTNIFLAPLSACSNLAFRMIAREHGAKFCFLEMLDAGSVTYRSPKARRILRTCPEDQPIAGQLLGLDPEVMLNAARIILGEVPITLLDINAACPVRKIVKKKTGASFLTDAEPLYRIIDRLAGALTVPVTVKMRVGINQVDISQAIQMAKGCESAGAAALFVHGRTRSQENSGPVSYEAIRAVKESVRVPVFGSGNILNPPLAEKMLRETGCDGVLVAKGAFGNPFIFAEIESYLQTGVWQAGTDLGKKLDVLKKHLLLFRRIEGPGTNWRIGELAKICLWYLKGFAEASRLRAKIFEARSDEELFGCIDSIRF